MMHGHFARARHLGALRLSQGRLKQAEALFRDAHERTRAVAGDDSREALYLEYRMGSVLRARGKLEDAEAYLLRALMGFQATVGDDHFDTLLTMRELALLRDAQERPEEALALLRQAREIIVPGKRKELELPLTSIDLHLGFLLRSQENWKDAEPLFREAYEIAAQRRFGAGQTARYMSHYGPCLVKLGRYQEAEKPLQEAYKLLTETGQERDERTRIGHRKSGGGL
jgi:tetratricopeptide (TPR) repeat protein